MSSLNEESAQGLVFPPKNTRVSPTGTKFRASQRVSFQKRPSKQQPDNGRREVNISQTSGGFKKADYELALQNTQKKSNQFYKGQQMGMMTDVQKLRVYGPSIALFFQFQKTMLYSFLIMAIISMAPIIYNVVSGTVMSSGTSLAYKIAATTIGNFSSSNSGYSIYDKYMNVIPDIVVMVVFIVFYFYWLHKGEVITEQIRSQVKLKSYYTIQLIDFAPGATPEDVHDFMSQFGGVFQVAPIKNYNETIALSRKIYDFQLELKELELKKNAQNTTQYDQKIAKDKQKIDQIYKELVLYQDDTKEEIIRYAIMFNSIEQRQKALKQLKQHEKKFIQCCAGKTDEKYLLCGQKVQTRACHHQPADIIWENQHINWSTRWIRVIFQTLFLLAGLAIGFFVISFLNILVPSSTSTVDTSSYTTTTIQSQSNTTIVQSWCIANHYSVIKSGSSSAIYTYCWDYIFQYYLKILVTISIAIGIVLIKFVLKHFTIFLSTFKRYKTYTEQSKDMVQNLFFVYSATTVLVTLLLQADIITIKFKDAITFFITNDYLVSNKNSLVSYSDFLSDWYLEIGYQIIFNAIILVFHPTFSMPFFYCFMEKLGKCRAHSQQVQAKMEKMMEPAQFQLESDYAQILTLIFMCLAFCGGMPLITVVCFFALFLRYFYQKFYFFRYCKVPKMMDEAIDNQITSLIPYGIIIHFCLSIWMYGCITIFTLEQNSLDTWVTNTDSTFVKNVAFILIRLIGTWYYTIFFFAFLAAWFFKQLIFNFFVKVFIATGVSHKLIPTNIDPNDFDGSCLKDFVSSKSLCDSYKIENNPDYIQVLEIMKRKRKFIVRVQNIQGQPLESNIN